MVAYNKIVLDFGANITFRFNHDDGMVFYVDDQEVYNNWGGLSHQPTHVDKYISAGVHNLRVIWWEHISIALLHIEWIIDPAIGVQYLEGASIPPGPVSYPTYDDAFDFIPDVDVRSPISLGSSNAVLTK